MKPASTAQSSRKLRPREGGALRLWPWRAIALTVAPPVLTVIMAAAALLFLALPALRSNLLGSKRRMARELVATASALVADYHARELKGDLSRAEAQRRAAERLRRLRYGPEHKDYFWINDLGPRMVMHPYRPDLEGADLSHFEDPAGKRLFVAMVDVVRERGEGFVEYRWQWKDDPGRIVPKVSFVGLFEPWGWVIGTGVYLEDAEAEAQRLTKRLAFVFVAILGVIILLAFLISWRSGRGELQRFRAQMALRLDEERLEALSRLNRMAESTLEELEAVGLAEAVRLTESEFGLAVTVTPGRELVEVRSWPEPPGGGSWFAPAAGPGPWVDAIARREPCSANGIECAVAGREQLQTRRYVSVPVLHEGEVLRVASICNAATPYDATDQRQLKLLLDAVWTVQRRRKAEADLVASHERFRRVMDALDALVYVSDIETHEILFVNRHGQDRFGLRRGQGCWRGAFESEPERCTVCVEQGLASSGVDGEPDGGAFVSYEYGDGEQGAWYECRARATRWADGRRVRLEVVTDVSERVEQEDERLRLEERLQHSQKMEAMGLLASGVAHDFNNLLTAIQAGTELIQMSLPPDSSEAGFAEGVLTATQRSAELTQQLLAYSRKGKLSNVPVDVHELILEVVGLLERSVDPRIEIRTELEASRCVVRGDPAQLQAALLNLGVNARDAMPRGGRLTFATRNVGLDEDAVEQLEQPLREDDYVEISVADTGVGISAELLDNIFEPFFTTKEPGSGTGLGLASVYGCARSHSGTVRAYSVQGRGATFRMLLPLSRGNTPPPARRPEPVEVQGYGRLLVVDDEELVRTCVSRGLRGMGFEVEVAADGVEALDIVRRSTRSFDLVLLDLVMPRLSGEDTFRGLSRLAPQTPVLLVSGFAHSDVVESVLREGAVGMIAKPFGLKELARTVAGVLSRSESSRRS